MTALDLTGRRALVTGGGIGIGREIALEFARAGADVTVTFRSHDGAEVVRGIEGFGAKSAAFELDATDSAAVNDVVARAEGALGGGLDIVVNNAGGLIGRVPISEMSDEHWHTVLDVNLTSAFHVSRAALANMPDSGRIINLGSIAAQTGGSTGSAAYAASKSALEGFTRGLAREVAPRGITVNLISPGYITDTPFHETFSSPEKRAEMVDGIPLGRAGYPADVAAAALFLASEAAGFQTGTVMDVNGGSRFSG